MLWISRTPGDFNRYSQHMILWKNIKFEKLTFYHFNYNPDFIHHYHFLGTCYNFGSLLYGDQTLCKFIFRKKIIRYPFWSATWGHQPTICAFNCKGYLIIIYTPQNKLRVTQWTFPFVVYSVISFILCQIHHVSHFYLILNGTQ